MSIADIPQLQGLTTEEKLQIIEELWDSLDQSAGSGLLTESEQAILDARLAEHEADPSSAISLAEFRKRWAERYPEWADRHGV